MKIKSLKHLLLLTAFIICGTTTSPAQAYVNAHVQNTTGAPMKTATITGTYNKTIAEVYITGKEADFDANQNVTKGAGYIQAVTNQFAQIVVIGKFTKGTDPREHEFMMRLGVSRIDWGEDGKTQYIAGLDPVIKATSFGNLKIQSDVKRPALKDGVLNLEVEKLGAISVAIKFGNKGTLVNERIFRM